MRVLVAGKNGTVGESDLVLDDASNVRWMWIDVVAGPDDLPELMALTDRYQFDRLAVRDAATEHDLPKVDDFGTHLLTIFHGLREDRLDTYEVDCFLSDRILLTVREGSSPAIESLWVQFTERAELAAARLDEVLALVADVLTRRLLSVLDAFDERVEDLVVQALRADPNLLEDLTAVRRDLVEVRRVVHPQREVLDLLRATSSTLIREAGRRRFSDVFDVASRAAAGLDEARAALAETLDAYRGAEARQATEVTKVLTVYAAIMLPLSLIAGVFGMNFTNLPWLQRSWGWAAAVGSMLFVAFVSLGVFVALGWIRRPSGRQTGRTLGRGLLEATRAPVHLVSALVEISTMPIRSTANRLNQPTVAALDPDELHSEHFGSE